MGIESGPKYTPKQQAEIEKSRTLSDADLLQDRGHGEAKYKVNKKGEKYLELTGDQMKNIKDRYEINYLPKDKRNAIIKIQKFDSGRIEAIKKFSADRDVVLAAVENDGSYLSYASPELRDEEDIVLAALKHDQSEEGESLLAFASERLKANKKIVLVAVQHDVTNFRYASQKLQKDPDLMKLVEAHKRFGHYL